MTKTSLPPPFSRGEHDHDACISQAMQRAETICAQRRLRLTPLRRRVLELVWRNHKPVRAYEILEHLGKDHSPVAPPTVYRALDFLLDAELIHRIESLNAFTGCESGHDHALQRSLFLICRECDATAELAGEPVDGAIARAAESVDFCVQGQVVEVFGVCPACSRG
jgi:Fur family zinc uptake transcriptional regulator